MSLRAAWQLKHKVRERERNAANRLVTIYHEITGLKDALVDSATPADMKVYSGEWVATSVGTNLFDLFSFVNSRGVSDSFNGLCLRQVTLLCATTNTYGCTLDTSLNVNAIGLRPGKFQFNKGDCVQANLYPTGLLAPFVVTSSYRYVPISFQAIGDSVEFVIVAGPTV